MSTKLTPKELFDALIEYKYVVFKDGNIIVTQDFYKDFGNPAKLETNDKIKHAASTAIMAPEVGIQVGVGVTRIQDTPLTKFIIDARVPEKAKTKTGSYYVNKYNSKAEKILIKALEKDKLNYDVLVASTYLYYKSGVMVKTIANYFLEGIWKDEYNALADKVNTAGDIQSYLKDALKEGEKEEHGSTSYRRR